jgi:hypothetical protein
MISFKASEHQNGLVVSSLWMKKKNNITYIGDFMDSLCWWHRNCQ